MPNTNIRQETSGYVTAAWVKTRYSIANSTLYQWIATKRLPAPVKIGPRAVRFRLTDIEAFEAGLAQPGDADQHTPAADAAAQSSSHANAPTTSVRHRQLVI